MEYDVVVIGAGAAGILAASAAASRGRSTLLVEKAARPGAKILMSGGTRCNLTQATDARGIVEAFGRPGRFLHGALAALPPDALVSLVEAEGVPTKVEPTGKVFPRSDRAADVLAALLAVLRRSGAKLALGEPALGLRRTGDAIEVATPARPLACRAVIVTSGGASYPGCGTTGDAYGWARALGHTVVHPCPALVPITTHRTWVTALRGVTVPDVDVDLSDDGGKTLAATRGSLLFTHFGLSGPAVLDISRHVARHRDPGRLVLTCDFLPGRSASEILEAMSRASGKRQVKGAVEGLPARLLETLLHEGGVPPGEPLSRLGRDARERVVKCLKAAPIPVTGTLGFRKAEVTAGGVCLDEVDSRTMQSRLAPGVYFAGEVLDLDGPIGGYNFQAAFSTGHLAGSSA